MDTERELALEAYIDQCEKAVEIQAFGRQGGKMKAGRWYHDFNSKKDIWAPYQCEWLALVMKERHNKTWTGKEWV